MLTITHTPAEGTLIEGTAKGDGTAEILKAHRWRWSATLGAWYIPRTRDTAPPLTRITAVAGALRAVGFSVATEVDHSTRPTAEVEADKATRAAQRAQRLAAKAHRSAATAQALRERSQAAWEQVPPDGQPILVGHHSEAGHRAAIKRGRAATRRHLEVEAAHERIAAQAAVAATAPERRYERARMDRRISTLKAQLRTVERSISTQGATSLQDRKAQLEDQITYWEQQMAHRHPRTYSQADISPGDRVLIRGTWWTVARANPKTCTLYFDPARKIISSYRGRYGEISDHRPATT